MTQFIKKFQNQRLLKIILLILVLKEKHFQVMMMNILNWEKKLILRKIKL